MTIEQQDSEIVTEDLAEQCYKEGNYVQALKYYCMLIDLEPSNASLYVEQGKCLVKLERYYAALKAFQCVIDEDIDCVDAQLGKCDIYLKMDKYSAVYDICERLLHKNPQNSLLYYFKGQSLRLQGKLVTAVEVFDNAILVATIDDDVEDFYYSKGLALHELKRYDEAVDAFDQAWKLNPQQDIYRKALGGFPLEYRTRKSSHYSREGEKYIAEGLYKTAIFKFDFAICLDAKFVPAHIGKGKALLALKNYEEALRAFNEALRLRKDDIYALVGKGDVLLALQQYTDAIHFYERAILLNEKCTQAYIGKGHALFAFSKYSDAINTYKEALELGIQHAGVYCNLATCFKNIEKFEDAITYYEESIALSPNQVNVYRQIGDIEYFRQNYEESFDAYEEAVSLGEDDAKIYLKMGDCVAVHDTQNDDSDFYYKKALSLANQVRDVHVLHALVYDSHPSSRPVSVQFDLFYLLMILTPPTELTHEEMNQVALSYEQCSRSIAVLTNQQHPYIQKLLMLLKHFPVSYRGDFLSKATTKDPQRLAAILIIFASNVIFELAGLKEYVCELVRQWTFTDESDGSNELASRLYLTLPTYNVPREEQEVFYIQLLFAQSQYEKAETLLAEFIKRPVITSRILWLFADCIQRSGRPLWLQIDILQRLTTLVPSDARLTEAWISVGNYCSEYEGKWQDARKAYDNAERRGTIAPILRAFRIGAWDAIPALYSTQDYHSPVIVALDLECAYRPDALPGSTIFEVGAVRRKGTTELDSYRTYVYHEFSEHSAYRRPDAKDVAVVMQELREFIGTDIVVGHNVRAFDSVQLRGVGLDLPDEQILDTLEFARLLYPDSIHHNLGFLCEQLGCEFDDQHNALPDSRACANLLHKLGDELVRRGESLIAGFRAFVPPDSAFDKAILQPREIAANPAMDWKLDPAPSPVHQLTPVYAAQAPASPHLVQALQEQKNALIERYDPRAIYIEHIPANRKTLVLAGNRQRLERMLLAAKSRDDVYVLPDPQTLLCPHYVQQRIEQQDENGMKLTLFCLYQASHNHDAQTLYPLRLPSDEMRELRDMLLEDCCGYEIDDYTHCEAHIEAQRASDEAQLLLATHNNFIQHQKLRKSERELLIVDNVDELQMHFVDYIGEYVDSDKSMLPELNVQKHEALQQLTKEIAMFAQKYINVPGYHERILLSVFRQWVQNNQHLQTALSRLETSGPVGLKMVQQIRAFADESLEEVQPQKQKEQGLYVRAYWLDLWFEASEHGAGEQGPEMKLTRWRCCKLNCDIPQTFAQYFLRGFKQYILCGDALSLGSFKTTFVRRFFGLSEQQYPFFADILPAKRLLIPEENVIGPSSFLNRYKWAQEVGRFLHYWMQARRESLMVTLYETQIAQAFAEAWNTFSRENHDAFSYQVLSPHLQWSSTKIAERLAMPNRKTLTFLSPANRRNTLDTSVDVEVIGPLRFLNRRDPVVAAMISAFAPHTSENSNESQSRHHQLYTYLLPQAMLELKTRLASPAQTHILLDSAIYSSVYRDEVRSLLPEGQIISPPSPEVSYTMREQANQFDEMLVEALERHGYGQQKEVLNKELDLVLETVWGSNEFKKYEREDGTFIEQKEIIRNVFDGKDQLVVVATGGGKSLCFQLPAILKAEDNVPTVTLVISPLIALMQDQVQNLNRKGIFSAIMLNSQLSPSERSAHLAGIRSGDYSIIYMAPEQIRSSALNKALEKRTIGLVAIDEAHCVSGWGHNFRTEYSVLKHWLADTIYKDKKRIAPVIALTATARSSSTGETAQSTVKDIIDQLGLQMVESQALIASPKRSELCLSVKNVSLSCPRCKETLVFRTQPNLMYCPSCGTVNDDYKGTLRDAKIKEMLDLLNGWGANGLRSRWDRAGKEYQRGIIYCRTRAATEKLVKEIVEHIPELHDRIDAYHAGLKQDERKAISSNFVKDDEQGIRLVVATNAFGMGIDAARLGYVVHFDVPATPENYYQEVGRAGRNFKDGETTQCILLYNDADIEDQRWLVSGESISKQDIERVYEVLCTLHKQRGRNDRFLASNEEIASFAGVDAEQVNTLLYYLEYHTTVQGEQVISSGEYATQTWVRFAQDYKKHISPSLGQEPRNLITLLETAGLFHLTAEDAILLNVESLNQYVEQQSRLNGKVYAVRSVEDELSFLVKHKILIRTCNKSASVTLAERQTIEDVKENLISVEQSVNAFFDQLYKMRVSQRRNSQNVARILRKCHVQGVSQRSLIHFLFLLSQKMTDDTGREIQLFEKFKRDIRSSSKQHSEMYKLRIEQKYSNVEECKQDIKKLFEQLVRTVNTLAKCGLQENEPLEFDPFRVTSSHEKGMALHNSIVRLETLGLLTYVSNAVFDATRYITLNRSINPYRVEQQDDIANVEDLVIDLESLYQQELYKTEKLALMKEYAGYTDSDERIQFLEDYFMGKRPLLKTYQIAEELIDDQRAAVLSTAQHQLVVGEAGSGKTKVLLERIKYLMYEKRIPTNRIIVFTHLNNAINRITHNIKTQRPEGEDKQQFPEMLTLNSFASRIFKKHYNKLMRPDGKAYYNGIPSLLEGNREKQEEGIRAIIRKDVFSLLWSNTWEYEQEVCRARFDSSRWRQRNQKEADNGAVVTSCLKAIEAFQQCAIFPGCSPQNNAIRQALKGIDWHNWDNGFYYAVYVTYLQVMGAKGYYTYDDQILFAYALLKQDLSLLHNYSYEYMFIDEVQDLTPAQIKLLQLLLQRNGRVFGAGDSGQSIIINKGQKISCEDKFLELTQYEASETYELDQNFRMSREIHNLALAVRNQNNSLLDTCGQSNDSDLPVVLPARTHYIPHGDGEKISDPALYQMLDAAIDYSYDHLDVVNNIAFIVAFSDWLSRCEEYLRPKGYQFVILGNTKKYQTRRMKNLLVHLRLIKNKECADDVEELISRCLPYDLSRYVIEQASGYTISKKISMWKALELIANEGNINLDLEYEECLRAHVDIIKCFTEDSPVRDVFKELQRIQKQYPDEDEEYDDEEEQNESFERQVNEWKTKTVEEVLQEVERHIPIVEDVEKFEEKNNPFILTTCDYAKSQDFDVVFIIGADHIKQRERLYVNISRAKKRLILVTNESSPGLLKSVPETLYKKVTM